MSTIIGDPKLLDERDVRQAWARMAAGAQLVSRAGMKPPTLEQVDTIAWADSFIQTVELCRQQRESGR